VSLVGAVASPRRAGGGTLKRKSSFRSFLMRISMHGGDTRRSRGGGGKFSVDLSRGRPSPRGPGPGSAIRGSGGGGGKKLEKELGIHRRSVIRLSNGVILQAKDGGWGKNSWTSDKKRPHSPVPSSLYAHIKKKGKIKRVPKKERLFTCKDGSFVLLPNTGNQRGRRSETLNGTWPGGGCKTEDFPVSCGPKNSSERTSEGGR